MSRKFHKPNTHLPKCMSVFVTPENKHIDRDVKDFGLGIAFNEFEPKTKYEYAINNDIASL